MADNKRIAKNTLFLYIRLLFVMGVMLYTSRVILHVLGVDDFGLYNVVGGLVAMLSFLQGTLSNGTSRFLTYELGANNQEKIKITFSTAFFTHFAIGLLIIVLLETIGLWYVYNKLVVAPERFFAAVIVFHISVFASLVNIMQIPYTALIIAHEEMGVYAYVGIFDAVARLVMVYLLSVATVDKLMLYAALMLLIHLLVAIWYWAYCHKHYVESRLRIVYDKVILKSMLGFSGWNILAHMSETLKLQGYLILLNLFFQPFVVAAQTIGNQIAGAMMQFIGNFRNAINPQIIKYYAAADYEESKRLTLSTTVLVFDMVLLLGLPTIFVMNTIMKIWLVEVPEYAVIFTQYIIVQRILSTFDASFYTPMMAAAKIKTNSIIGGFMGIGTFVVLYLIFKLGGDVMWLQYVGVIFMAIYSLYIKPALLVKEVEGYKYSDFVPCYLTCLKVSVLSVIVSLSAYCIIGNDGIISSLILFVVSFLGVVVSSYIFLEKEIKIKLNAFISQKLNKRN